MTRPTDGTTDTPPKPNGDVIPLKPFLDAKESEAESDEEEMTSVERFTLACVIFVLFCFFVAYPTFMIFRGHFVDPARGVVTMENHGFTDVVAEDKYFFLPWMRGCDFYSAAKISMNGVNPQGERVEIYACCGLIKGCDLLSE